MTDREWEAIAFLLGECWKGDFTEDKSAAYKFMLKDYDRRQMEVALKRLSLRGQPWLPTVPEIIETIRMDASAPTWDEAWQMIRHALRAPPARPFTDYDVAKAKAVAARADTMHPLIGSFIQRQGIQRLLHAPVDGEHGHWELKRLREAWQEHAEVMQDRENVAIASGSGKEGLRQLDPMAAIGRPELPELPAGDPLDF